MKEADSQSKPQSTAGIEPRTDSAPSVLGVQQSAANETDTDLSASQSVPAVVVQPAVEVVSASYSDRDVTDTVSCADRVVTRTSPQLMLATAASIEPVSHVTEAATQLPPTLSTVDAGAAGTDITDNVTNVATTSSGLKRSYDEAVESAKSKFIYHEESACDHVITRDNMSSVTLAPSDSEADFNGPPSNLGAGNYDAVLCMSLDKSDSENAEMRSTSESGSRRSFAAFGPAVSEMPCVDESVSMSGASDSELGTNCDAVSQPVVAIVTDDESGMSVTAAADAVCQFPTVADNVGDVTTMSCCSAVAVCDSNDESHSTIDDMHLVSNSRLFIVFCEWNNSRNWGWILTKFLSS